jgi:hypothetical protein
MIKDPDDIRDLTWNWAQDLGTDTITAATFTITPTGGLTAQSTSHDTTTATVRLSGGVAGVQYTVTSRVTTSRGQQLDWSHLVLVKDQ